MESSSRPVEVRWIDLDRIRPNPWNPNIMPPERMKKLKNEIRASGFSAPILVRPAGDKFEIVDGEHRYRIAVELGLSAAPTVVSELDDLEARLKTLQMNGLRGQNDPEKLAGLLADLLAKRAAKQLAARLPWTELEIAEMAAKARERAMSAKPDFTNFKFKKPDLEIFAVTLNAEQKAAVDRAIGRAKELDGSKDLAGSLVLVCQGFLQGRGE